jgi:hypothetical protein
LNIYCSCGQRDHRLSLHDLACIKRVWSARPRSNDCEFCETVPSDFLIMPIDTIDDDFDSSRTFLGREYRLVQRTLHYKPCARVSRGGVVVGAFKPLRFGTWRDDGTWRCNCDPHIIDNVGASDSPACPTCGTLRPLPPTRWNADGSGWHCACTHRRAPWGRLWVECTVCGARRPPEPPRWRCSCAVVFHHEAREIECQTCHTPRPPESAPDAEKEVTALARERDAARADSDRLATELKKAQKTVVTYERELARVKGDVATIDTDLPLGEVPTGTAAPALAGSAVFVCRAATVMALCRGPALCECGMNCWCVHARSAVQSGHDRWCVADLERARSDHKVRRSLSHCCCEVGVRPDVAVLARRLDLIGKAVMLARH